MALYKPRIQNRLLFSILAMCLLVAFTPGCKTAPVSGKVGLSAQKQAKVVAKGFTLQHYLRTIDLKPERVGDNLLNIKLSLENVDSTDFWCDIQVVFYDADGFILERTNWQPLLVASEEITFFETTSLSSAVEDFSILVRKPRRSQAW